MGMLEVKDVNRLIPALNKLTTGFEAVFIFKASYPANHLRFAANHPWRKPGATITHQDRAISLYPMYCVESSFGAELHPQLNVADNFQIIYRGQNHSQNPAFYWEDDQFINKLKANAIKEISITGIIIDQDLLQKSISKLESEGFAVNLKQELIHTEVLPYS